MLQSDRLHACLDPELVVNFLIATQPREWDKLQRQHGPAAKERFLKRLASEVERRGALDVLRGRVKDSGAKFHLAFFRPSSALNPESQQRYRANAFSVIRQVRYSADSENSLDLVLFLNGLPIFTVELKSQLNGQTVEDAIWQYRNDRDPREPLFRLGRCLAHFAVDNGLAYMAAELAGRKTMFLPFKQGYAGGAGNLPSLSKHATAYLWEDVWAPDSVLELVEKFCADFVRTDSGGRRRREVVFPRYHQRDAVRRLIADVREHGPGRRYLVQHSAGSGKSNTIAWLAHQLSTLHGGDDRRVFDSIVVITDRRVLDRQIQRTIGSFVTQAGVVANIDGTSRQLQEALEQGKTIVVTTLQKFPVIFGAVGELPGKRFAVIIDEAHSSQTGEASRQMRAVLARRDTTGDGDKGGEADEEPDLEDLIVAEIERRGHRPNISTFAFTATPKQKTLEMFGVRRPDGKFEPFSLYSMRQAIEERFILDVLENYTTHETYWRLLKRIEDDPEFDKRKAQYLLRQFVNLHEHTIGKKTAIMVEHFADHVRHRIDGKAKAMIVTASRLHAVRYKLAVDAYIAEQGYPFKALVAFSGTVPDGGREYTEANMNGFPEAQTAETFKRDEYRILVVAEKFQTGFNQPLLHTMYVDKRLSGVHAVQTLSRLNRTHPGKAETMVLGFVNTAEEIREAFAPYYDRTILSEETDPNLLYDRQRELERSGFYTHDEVERFARAFWNKEPSEKKQPRLMAATRPAVDRFHDRGDEREREGFRKALGSFVRLYAFLSQVVTFQEPEWEKLYWFGKALLPQLTAKEHRLPVEVQDAVDMESYRLDQTRSGRVELERGQHELPPISDDSRGGAGEERRERVSVIIEELNSRFGTEFDEEDMVPAVRALMAKLERNEDLRMAFRVNPSRDAARMSFNKFIEENLLDFVETNFAFFKKVNDDEQAGRFFKEQLYGWYLSKLHEANELA